MTDGNLALKLEDFEDDYCELHVVYDSEQNFPNDIIQFPVSKTKNTLNRLATVTNPDDEVTTYTYDDVSNLTKTLYDSGAEANYTFSSLNRLLTLTNEKANEDVISSYSYTYDDNGMRTGVTLDNDDTIVYTYDAINQLTDEVKADSAAQELYSYDYSFDDAGNRLSLNKKLDASATNISNPTFWDSADTTYFAYTYDNENRLTQLSAKINNDTTYIVDYTYDDNGNMTEKEEYDSAVQQDKDTTTYTYDYENRLTEITHADSSASEYTYDGVGKRIKTVEKNSQGTVTSTTKFLYDGLNVVIERDASDQTTAAYTRGQSYGGGIGGIISKKTSATTSYFHYDGIGTVTGLTDSNEAVVQTYIYEAYGNLLYSTGSETNNHLFSTKEHSAKSSLSYFGARYYDPKIGRFITKDPLGMIDGPNVYLYVNNNPVNLIDPWGLCEEEPSKQEELSEQVKPVAPSPSAAFWGGFGESLKDQGQWMRHPLSTGAGKSPMAQAKALGKGYYRAEQLLVGGGSAALLAAGAAAIAPVSIPILATILHLQGQQMPPISQAEIWRMIGNQLRTTITLIIK